jgi:hypothetical protein
MKVSYEPQVTQDANGTFLMTVRISTREQRLNYLVGLVRREIRRHQKSIDKWEARQGQDLEEAVQVLREFTAKQLFRREVAEELSRQLEAEKE